MKQIHRNTQKKKQFQVTLISEIKIDCNHKNDLYYRVIAVISANIVSSLDIEGRELASARRYPKRGTIFADISAITLLLYSFKYLN